MELFHEATITLRVEQMRTAWCVYSHHLLPNDREVFFIGMTRLLDVFQHKDAYHNHHWVNTVKETDVIKTIIIQTSLDKNDCYRYQSNLIRQFRPIANVQGFKITGKNVITCTQGPNEGKTYGTVTEAAERNGISQPAMSNHLNGRKGYEMLRGMKFKRGLP